MLSAVCCVVEAWVEAVVTALVAGLAWVVEAAPTDVVIALAVLLVEREGWARHRRQHRP